jgi:hypothetical protein
MKRIFLSLTIFTLLLTACGSSLTVIDGETLSSNPELKGVAESWQGIVDAAATQDCERFLSHMRSSLQLTEEDCTDAFEYLEDVPEIDWARTEWNSSGGKAKIYKMESGSLTGFILNEANDVWGADEKFWE